MKIVILGAVPSRSSGRSVDAGVAIENFGESKASALREFAGYANFCEPIFLDL